MASDKPKFLINVFRETWTPPEIDTVEFTRLYRSIEESLQRRPGSSVAVTSVHQSDEVLRLTYNLAWVGSELLGKRVLFLHVTEQPYKRSTVQEPPRSSPALSATRDSNVSASGPGQVLIAMNDAEFDRQKVGLFSLTMSSAKDSAITPQLAGVWGKLQASFDMIIIAAPPVLNDPTATCLGSLVDGNVLIVSSGQSREKQVNRAIDLLTSGATPLLGVIMTDRKHTLPRWIRWMFRQKD